MKIKNIMALVAHADDETLGCGGYIPHLVDRGCDVNIVIVSNGIITVRNNKQDNKPDAYKACKILGVENVNFLNYEDQKFDKYAIADIANSVSRLKIRPDLIITHVDTDLNKDHRIVADVAKIIGRPKDKPVIILGCEIPGVSAWNAKPFWANYYVDVKNTLKLKIEAFSKYKNEIQKFPHPCSAKGLIALAKCRGIESGYYCAEAFNVIRMFD